ncbi:MAG: hypothetical protein JXA67_17645 [Micromonosporaceae bacterium]|nr:hypothetical protein [Micromonosporaceae bacterium]
MSSDVQKRAAYLAGRLAARIGRPLKDCPYTPQQQSLRLWFIRGYRSWEMRRTN